MEKVSPLTLKAFDWQTGDPSTIQNVIDRIKDDPEFEQKCIDILNQQADEPDFDPMLFWIILALGQGGSEDAVEPLLDYLDHSSSYLLEEFALHALSHLEEAGARGVMRWVEDEDPSGIERLSAYTILEDVVEFGDQELQDDTIDFLKDRVEIEIQRSGPEHQVEQALYALAALGADEFVLETLEDLPENPETQAIEGIVKGEKDFSDMRMYNKSWREFADKKM